MAWCVEANVVWQRPEIPNLSDWSLIAATGAVTFVWGYLAGFNLPSVAVTALGNAMLLLFCAGYLKAQNKLPDLAVLFGALAWVLATATIMSHASYVWASANLPMVDGALARIDTALGADARAITQSTGAFSWLSYVSLVAYSKTAYQMFLAFAVLMYFRQHERLADTFSILTIGMVATLVLSTLFPAADAFDYYKFTEADLGHLSGTGAGLWHLEHLNALRSGAMRTFPTTDWQGLVTFPSFHTIYALAGGYALATTRYLAWPSAIFSGFVLFTTVPIGGHYFVDIVGGVAIFMVSVRWVEARRGRTSPRMAETAPGQLAFGPRVTGSF